MVCPRCQAPLRRVRVAHGGIGYACPSCQGKALSWAVVRNHVPHEFAVRLWQEARRQSPRRGAACPICRRTMALIGGEDGGPAVTLDVCPTCYVMWLDRAEWEALPARPSSSEPEKELSPQAREALALAKLKQMKRREELQGEEEPVEPWQWILGLFGLPVELEGPTLATVPWVTWGIVFCCVLVYLYSFRNIEVLADVLGFIPGEALRFGGITLITSFFLHGGFWHLLGNMYFLLVFGDNVEDHLGRWFYIGLIVVSHLVGSIFHFLGDPRSDIPCIGASAGISGVIVFYGLQFPRAKLGLLLRFWFVFKWLRFSALWGLLAWVLLQVWMAYEQLAGITNVSALAHLGGATVGLIAWLTWKYRTAIAI